MEKCRVKSLLSALHSLGRNGKALVRIFPTLSTVITTGESSCVCVMCGLRTVSSLVCLGLICLSIKDWIERISLLNTGHVTANSNTGPVLFFLGGVC